MKNLRKVLALVLVFATLLGLAAMASATTSEDYSDADSISHIEAVDVMSTIGVFDGISGSFSGSSILTREQAAKIITYMILGKDEADALVASVAPYTDVARDRWSAGSIAYCKNEGILAGVGNGRFEPDGKLTGVAFAKMCLVALGYDPTIEDLTGSQWAVNTSRLAIAEAGITASLSQASLADEMSREDACQMAFNTLQADMVDYANRGGNFTVNGAVINQSATKAQPVSTATGWADTNRRDGNIYAEAFEQGKDGIQQFAEKYFVDLAKSETILDSFGRPSVKWTYKADGIGTYIRNDWLVKSWTAKASRKEMYDAIGSSTYDNLFSNNTTHEYDGNIDKENKNYYFKNRALTIRVDGEKLDRFYGDNSVTVDGNKIWVSEAKKDLVDYFFDKNSTKEAGVTVYNAAKPNDSNIGITGNGVLTEVYKNNKGDVWVAIINTYLVQATADYNSSLKRVNVEAMPIDDNNDVPLSWLPTYISGEDFDVSNVKEGDYLLITVSVPEVSDNKNVYSTHDGNNFDTVVESVTPATLQTASVTEYTERDSVTMGGTKYSYNKILGDNEKSETFAINSDATLVLDTYGYIMYVTDAMTSSNFVYIDNYAEGTHLRRTFIADAYFADGTNSEITVGKIDGYRIGEDPDHEINVYRSKYLWSNDYHLTYDTAELEGERIPGPGGKSAPGSQRYTHWYTFSGSNTSEYTLRTPSSSRYEAPQSALIRPNVTTDKDITLVQNGKVAFMSGVEDAATMEMYRVRFDTNTKTTTTTEPDKSLGTSETRDELKGIRGNSKTIFIVKNTKGDVDTYTGIANVPDVILKANSDESWAKVSWVCAKDSKYASYVYVDVYNTGADVEDKASDVDYLFTVDCTSNRTYNVDGLDYLKYTVIINDVEEERWISTQLVDTDDEGKLFRKIKVDSYGRITGGTEVGSDKDTEKKDKQITLTLRDKDGKVIGDGTIKHSNNSLRIEASKPSSVGENLYTSKTNINLVVKNTTNTQDFLKDTGNDYETHLGVSSTYVSGMLQNYHLGATVYYVLDDVDDDVVDVMWIYVTDAVKQ